MLQFEPNRNQSILDRLSPREREVATWFMLGLTQQEIGYWLDLTTRTVQFHMFNALRKSGLNSGQLFGKLVKDPDIFKLVIEHEKTFEPIDVLDFENHGFVHLTRREKDVLKLVLFCEDAEVAEQLGLSKKTVHFFLRNLLKRFKVRNRRELRVRVVALIHRGDKALAELFPELSEISSKVKEEACVF